MARQQSRMRGRLGSLSGLMLLAILPGCQTTTDSGATEKADLVACGAFEPFRWSSKDTPESILQAKEHNAAGRAICGWQTK